jgi:hypothetical protein
MGTIDEEQTAELLGRFVDDLGATVSAGNLLIGDKLGLHSYDAETGRYSMTKAQALAFADPAGPVLPGAFQLAVACLTDESMILDAFRTGRGVAWGEHDPGVFTGCERFHRPGQVANLVSSWVPAVAGLGERLVAGIPVADVGCGLGASTRILADTYPASSVRGFDPHLESVVEAAGFRTFRRVAETPFNLVYEARP